jgi:hypothetical protein
LGFAKISRAGAIEPDLQVLFLGGAFTRTVELMGERLFGRRLSSDEVQRPITSPSSRWKLGVSSAWRRRSICTSSWGDELLDAPRPGGGEAVRTGGDRGDRAPLAAGAVRRDRLSAKRALERFRGKWGGIYSDAVRCLEKDFDALIAFLEFPEEEWMHLRTTNTIERLNNEFKRRTEAVEIVAGEASVYTIFAFVAVKMERSWRNAPFRNSGSRKPSPSPAMSQMRVDTTGILEEVDRANRRFVEARDSLASGLVNAVQRTLVVRLTCHR